MKCVFYLENSLNVGLNFLLYIVIFLKKRVFIINKWIFIYKLYIYYFFYINM